VNVSLSSLYTFKNFTDLTEQESEEVLHGRNDAEVRRWMTSDRVITAEEHRHFMSGLQRNPRALYVRIERAGRFAGVYSLNDLAAGSGLGGFWVTAEIRERLLPLNVVFQGMNYMFSALGIERIYGCQKQYNLSAIRLNALLGLALSESGTACSEGMQQIEITKQQWQQKTAQDANLLKLMNRMEVLNGTTKKI
jgi:UDP-4-amino-4,6-dideoxy-N-acetyl-beta-L-altrosamine N-acetyltransferase